MANLIAKKIKNQKEQIKLIAEENKKLVGKQKNVLKQEQPKETFCEIVEIVKEPQTIMLDI